MKEEIAELVKTTDRIIFDRSIYPAGWNGMIPTPEIRQVMRQVEAFKDAQKMPSERAKFSYLDPLLRSHLDYQRHIRKYCANRLRENYFLYGDGYDFSMFNV